jgi:hypothetical protein
MPAPDSLVNYGSYPELNIVVSTADVLMDSHGRTASRDEDLFIGAASKGVERAMYSNPMLTLDFAGFVAAHSGWAASHPGARIAATTDIPAWPTGGGANVFGFDGSTGNFIQLDQKTDGTREGKLINFSCVIKHFPLMTAGNPT